MKTSTLADIAAAAAIALAMTVPDVMAAPVYEQAPTGPNVGYARSFFNTENIHHAIDLQPFCSFWIFKDGKTASVWLAGGTINPIRWLWPSRLALGSICRRACCFGFRRLLMRNSRSG